MDFKDLGNQSSDNFWFRAKNDLIETLLSNHVKGKRLNILNLGAGTGSDLDVLNKFGDVTVIDINQDALDLIPNNKCKLKILCDACNLPFYDNYFDLVVSFDVFEHIENDVLAISECHRVIKKDGHLVFSVPAYNYLFGSHDIALEHKRRYSKYEIKDKIEMFKNINLFSWNSLLLLPIGVKRILNKNSAPKVDDTSLPIFLDKIFYCLIKFDNFLIKHKISLPFGLSIVGVVRK